METKNTYRVPDNLLTYDNAKTTKGESLGVLTGILYLAPADISGTNLCPWSSEGCRKACLFTAGRGAFANVFDARLNKTKYFLQNRKAFVAQIISEITKAKKRAKLLKLKLAIRLNGTSDIPWEIIAPEIFETHKDTQFYDYTKGLSRLKRKLPSNYNLTFSRAEDNETKAIEALSLGFNVAAVFEERPKTFLGHKTIDGDLHDIRFLDKTTRIVALKAKGKAKKDITNFVIRKVA